ncbi:MAG: hypothetical protein ACOC2N_01930 [Spirochaetota bacterium]
MKRNYVVVIVSVTATLLVLAVAGLLIWRASPMSSFGPDVWGGRGMSTGFMREIQQMGDWLGDI